MKKILIFGGSGFIGRHLVEELHQDYELTIVTRNKLRLPADLIDKTAAIVYDPSNKNSFIPHFEATDCVINLAGENVDGKWTEKKKELILESRLSVDRFINDTFMECKKKPETIIQGSGIGYYGLSKNDDPVMEDFLSYSNSFLTNVAFQHEEIFDEIGLKTRLIFLRTGIVLHKTEGALPRMAMPVKFFSGKMGDGQQWLSWIHIQDEVKAIRFLIENKDCEGAFNLTAPNPVRQEEFVKLLAKTMNKSVYFSVPSTILKTMLGEMADELLLNGMRIVPEKLLKAGFKFQYETLEKALYNMYK